MRQHDLARARAIVERTRAAQGLDPRVTDPAMLKAAVAVFEVADPAPGCRCAENAARDAAVHGELPHRCAGCGERVWHPTLGISTPLYGCIACYRR